MNSTSLPISESILESVKTSIINAVNLHHIDPKSVSAETSLREGGLELDSVDLLEVIVTIEHQFGVKVDDPEAGKKYFRTVGSVAELVQKHQAEKN